MLTKFKFTNKFQQLIFEVKLNIKQIYAAIIAIRNFAVNLA
jgi:hypothetical protein